MLDSLNIEIQDKLKPVDDLTWNEFFKGHCDSASMVELMQASGTKPVKLMSILVKSQNKPVVILPLFLTEYPLLTSVMPDLSDNLKKILQPFEKVLNNILKIKVLGIGFVEGEYGQIGMDPSLLLPDSQADLDNIWTEIFKTLKSMAKIYKLDLIAFKDFTDLTLKELPEKVRSDYICANSLPFCYLNINFKTIDEYFNQISNDMKRYLKHSLKKSANIKTVLTENPSEAEIETIYYFYAKAVSEAELFFGQHNKEYFQNITKTVENAKYILFYLDDKLIGFDLVVINNGTLVQKYIGFDKEVGKNYNLYFRAFIEKLNLCLDQNLNKLYLGASLEETKHKLGCKLIYSYIYFQHKNPLVNKLLSRLKPMLEYKSRVAKY